MLAVVDGDVQGSVTLFLDKEPAFKKAKCILRQDADAEGEYLWSLQTANLQRNRGTRPLIGL
ncbi:MAG: hypothetical protein ACK5MO_05395 [Planctomyces sp.]